MTYNSSGSGDPAAATLLLYGCFDSGFIFFPQHVLRVSFSPCRDHVCRHCWISSFWIPWENGYCCLTRCSEKNTLDNTEQRFKNK